MNLFETPRRGLVDLSSVLWTALLGGKDTEHGFEVTADGKKKFVNSATWGYEGAMRYLAEVMKELNLTPHQLIIVVEGRGSKLMRQSMHPPYKSGRDKLAEQYEQFNLAKEQLLNDLLALGANACWQDGGVEADDVIGYLAQNLRGFRYIISGDKDLAQLVGPGPKDRLRTHGQVFRSSIAKGEDDSAWTGFIHHYRNGEVDKNPFGPFPHRLIPVAIATWGDGNDKIPGAKGFGETAFQDLLIAFAEEGLELLEQLIQKGELYRLKEDVAELKSLQKIIDDQAGVKLSYQLGRLHTHRVNTVNQPLQWRVGMVKPRSNETHELLRSHAGVSVIVGAEKYDKGLERFKQLVQQSPFVALDVETATPPESDDWLERLGKDEARTPVDVFGSFLTSVQVTFGPNLQYSFYLPVRNNGKDGVTNLSLEQVANLVACVPASTPLYIHNAGFELPVCYLAWGEMWADDPDWHGFLPNVIDTMIGASYEDENESAGLKKQSARLMGYEQVTYDEVTTKTLKASEWDGTGKLLSRWVEKLTRETGEFEEVLVDVLDENNLPIVDQDGNPVQETSRKNIVETYDGDEFVKVQYKMDALSATEVVGYGCDDTVCTAALGVYQRIIMELEETWGQYLEVEQLPAYVTAKGFVDGVSFSLETMAAQEKEDDEAYDNAWAVLRQYLIDVGFDGVHPPVFTELTPAAIKEAFQIVTGEELKTAVRTPSKIAKLIRQRIDDGEYASIEEAASLVASTIEMAESQGIRHLNELVVSRFSGEPKLDLASPKQMARLMYDVMGVPIRIANPCTPTEKRDKPDLADAVRRFSRLRAGHNDVTLTEDDMKLVRIKAQTNDTAVDTALAFDLEIIGEEVAKALKAIKAMKTVMTRRSLFYANYWNILHWKDGKIHPSLRQCGTVTRRYSSSNPNVQQLPKKGEGAKFRKNFLAHHRNAVVFSCDESSQELRLAAHVSQDPNLLACYRGENLLDVHSLTASGAMVMKWGKEEVERLLQQHGSDIPAGKLQLYTLFERLRARGKRDPLGKRAIDLRTDAKGCNFSALFGGKPSKIAETLIMRVEDATTFLNARNEMFPGLDQAAAKAERMCQELGYTKTLMGVRRHLGAFISSDDKSVSSRAARQAFNAEIQSSAGEQIKLSMARLWREGLFHRFDLRFMFQVHDELVFSVNKDEAVEAMRVVQDAMSQQYADLCVPAVGSLSVGRSFGDQVEVDGDPLLGEPHFYEQKIRKVLDDLFALKEAA